MSEILLLPGGVFSGLKYPFHHVCRMKYPKYNARYHKHTGTLLAPLFLCVYELQLLCYHIDKPYMLHCPNYRIITASNEIPVYQDCY